MIDCSNTQRIAAFSWLLVVITVTLLAVMFATKKDSVFDTSIFALLPESDQSELVKKSTEKMAERYARRLIILLSGDDDNEVRKVVTELAQKLSNIDQVSRLLWQVEGNQAQQFRDELYPYRFSVLDPDVNEELKANNFQSVSDKALLRLYSILSVGQSSMVEDPFGLFAQSYLNQSSDLNLQVSRSMLKVSGVSQPSYVIMLNLSGDPFSPELQQSILSTIEAERAGFEPSGITLRMSGLLLHAAAGAKQATQEISTIGLGSLLGIVAIMLLVFQRLKPLLLMLFPVMIGCITASAATLLFFGKVHLVTFAFGAGLVGVSIDYALHYLCQRRVSQANQVLKKIMPGLMLGLFSSVMAYAAQSLTPFPGLRQMAFFSVIGLSSAWLTVVLWFPLLTKNDLIAPLAGSHKLNALRLRFPRLECNRKLAALLFLISLLSAYTLSKSDNHEDIRLLQTSSPALIAQEQTVQKMLALSSSAQFFLINANSIEHCLRIEESLMPALDLLIDGGDLDGYLALAKRLPSVQQQEKNIAMVSQLYQQQLRLFFQQLNISDNRVIEAQKNFDQHKKERLTAEIWLKQSGSANWRDLIIEDQPDNSISTVIRLNGLLNEEVKQVLITLAEKHSGVQYIDQTQNISDLMEKYRSEVISWVSLAYLFVFVVLTLRYKRQVWRVVLPPLLASLLTLALLVQLEQGINLFHLMALILVLGIGLDMGIFLTETGGASHTWLAVSLSTYTSLLAFGLLALSNTPVLHHFGMTVLFGLCFVWLLVPIMRDNLSKEQPLKEQLNEQTV